MENRIFKAAASASPPTAPITPSNGYPTDGNPSTGTPATLPGAFWFHKIGEELRAVITGFGLTPADTALNQVFLAIQAAIARNNPVNPVNLGQFDSSLAVNGWKKYPDPNSPTGYFIEQWGQTANFSAEGGQVITMPISFPNKMLSATAATLLTSTTQFADQWPQTYGWTPGSPSSTIGIYMQCGANSLEWPISATWTAKGY